MENPVMPPFWTIIPKPPNPQPPFVLFCFLILLLMKIDILALVYLKINFPAELMLKINNLSRQILPAPPPLPENQVVIPNHSTPFRSFLQFFAM